MALFLVLTFQTREMQNQTHTHKIGLIIVVNKYKTTESTKILRLGN